MDTSEEKLIRKLLHDINNALVSITGFAEIMSETKTGKVKDYADHILYSTSKLESKIKVIRKKLFEEKC